MAPTIISADSHIDLGWLPGDTFVSRVPKRWAGRAPRIEESDGGRYWVADGIRLSGVESVGSAGRPYIPGRWQRADRFADAGLFTDGLRRPANPEERVSDQDRDGVSAEVLYGLFGIGNRIPDADLLLVIMQAFNDWLAEFCQCRPDRYVGLALLPHHDAEAASREIARSAELGLRGGVLDIKNGYRPVWHPDWDVVWATAQELSYPISFHTSKRAAPGPPPGLDKLMDTPTGTALIEGATSMSMLQFEGSADYFSIIFGGALDRFPELTIVLAESGIGWIPAVLERMDWQYDNEFQGLGLELQPSEYWHRQMYATFQWDRVGMHLLPFLGTDHVMYASDFPHPDGTWPDSREIVATHMTHLDENDRHKVICGNAARVYRLNL